MASMMQDNMNMTVCVDVKSFAVCSAILPMDLRSPCWPCAKHRQCWCCWLWERTHHWSLNFDLSQQLVVATVAACKPQAGYPLCFEAATCCCCSVLLVWHVCLGLQLGPPPLASQAAACILPMVTTQRCLIVIIRYHLPYEHHACCCQQPKLAAELLHLGLA